MISYDLARATHRRVQSGDIGVSHDRLGMSARRVIVEMLQDAHHTVTTPQAPDCVDGIIAQRRVHVRNAVCVLRREITVARKNMLTNCRFPAERASSLESRLHIATILQWTGWCDERYPGARACRLNV